jgi:tRNA(fMet)-specific endonuclease VapC
LGGSGRGDETTTHGSSIAVGTLIDSSVLIAAERGQLDLEVILAERAGEEFAISAITASELLHGVHRAQTSVQRSRREAFVEGLLVRLPVCPFDLVTARIHARLAAQLARQGVAVGPHDLLIATTAITKGYAIATRDERSFPKIPGLSLLRW